MSKFGARKVTIDGIAFASQAEGNRYAQLKLLERAREIKALGVHPKYPLKVNGVVIGVYTADFAYFEGGRQIVEDVKGMDTPLSKWKRKHVAAQYGIDVRIVK